MKKNLSAFIPRYILLMVMTVLSLSSLKAQTETISSGSFIINMGATNPNTIANGLKPYGLVYDLIRNYNVPIKWVISQSKLKDGVDFTYNGVQNKGGTFIIQSEFRSTAVNNRIIYWTGQGVVGSTTTSSLTVDVTKTLVAVPKWTLDATNGAIAEGYLINAGVTNTTFPGAYNWKLPQALDCCDDFFVMPHADPSWATHSRLLSWNKDCLGSIWAACHATSALENMVNPSDRTQQTNFLTQKVAGLAGASGNYALSNSLILWGSHGGGSVPYIHQLPGDPVAQYMGITDAATINGSEQIDIPNQSATGGWNPGAKIIAYDPTQLNVTNPLRPDLTNAAALMVYGRGFDDPTRGFVMYEPAHSHNKGSVNDVAAQRAFWNFSFFQVQPKAPAITVSGVTTGQNINGGSAVPVSVSATSPLVGVTFTYLWSSNCGGGFANATATATTFTAPVVASPTPCVITCKVTDNCGRASFQSFPVVILSGPQPPVANPDAASISVTCGAGTPVTTNVLANDTDPGGLPMTLTNVTGASNGTVSFTASGNVTFTPDANFTGPMALTYTVCNNATPVPQCASGIYTISTSGGSTPAAANDAYTIAEDAIGNFNVLANDAVGLAILGITSFPANGKLSINVNNTITYLPDADFAGVNTFTYKVVNASGGTNTATVTVTVTNDACDGGTYQSAAGSSGSYSQNPNVDAYLDQTQTSRNYGICAVIRVDGDGGASKNVHGTLSFDLSSIPATATISAATLTMQATTVKSNTAFQIDIHRITNTWNQGTLCNSANTAGSNGATWNNRNFATAWTAAGGDYNATISASTNVGALGSYSWSGANFNTLIQNWVNGTNVNNGMLLKFNTETSGNQNKDFNSSDAAANKPTLVFNWSTPSTCSSIPTRAPISMPDTASTVNGTAVNIATAANDYFPVAGAVTYSIITAPASGSATINAAGVVNYTPSGSFNGVRTLTYEVVHTASGLKDSGVVYINISNARIDAVNDAPAGANSGVVQTINVRANDTDMEGAVATSTVSIATAPKNGSATVNGAGNIVYTANTGFTGSDTLFYSLCEPAPACGSPLCDTARLVITVINQKPVANNDSKTILPCYSNTITLINNDTDTEGNTLTVTNLSPLVPATTNTLVNNNDGTVTFNPGMGITGVFTFTYTVTDNGLTSETSTPATVTITVANPVNAAPVAVNDAETINMDQKLYYSVRDNDSDPNNNPLTIPTITVAPIHGTAVVNPVNGQVEYTPNPGYFGTDVLTYRICDIPILIVATCSSGPDLCATATLTITVAAPNTVVALNDENSTWINVPVSGAVMPNDYDPEADTKIFTGFLDGGTAVTSGSITVSGVDATGSPVANAGSLTINADGSYTFTPANNFTGVVSVPYTISDDRANAAVDTAILRITVSPYTSISNSIIANNDENKSYGAPVSGNVVTNDSDPQGNAFSVTGFKYDTNGDGTADGTGTVGTPVSIAGITTSGAAASNAGSLTLNADGSYSFTPASDFHGSVDVPYTICDNGTPVACQTAVLHIDVIPDINGPLNDPPVAGDDFNYTNINTPVNGTFINNDSDPNSNPVSLNGTTINTGGPATPVGAAVTTAKGGTIQYYANGTYTYTPPVNYTGPDSVAYTICDVTAIAPQPLCTKAFIHLLVGVNNTTDAINDENSTWQDVNVSGGVLQNDFDKENNTQTFGNFILQNMSADMSSGATITGTDKTGTPVANAGILTFDANGNYTFDPDPAFTGTVGIPYRLCDNGNLNKCDTAYLTITVDPLPTSGINSVIANNDENISYGSAVSNNLFINDRDPQSDAFTVTNITGGSVGAPFTVAGIDQNGNPVANAGTLVVNANGSYTYTPAAGFVGSINAPYSITDALGATSTAILHIDVLWDPNGPSNDPPVAADDFGYTTINKPVTGSFINNDSDPNADPISFNGTTIVPGGPATPIGAPVATAQGGTIQFYANGTYTYTPPLGYVGPDKINYTICDVTVIAPQPLCSDALIHLLVGPGINISGKVWDDANGNIVDAGATEPETNASGTLYVNLVDGSGNVVATSAVAANGSYSFTDVNPGATYMLVLSTTQGTIGLPAPAATLPAGWANTGETRNGTIDMGTSGVIDTRNYGYTNTINFDFGIEQLPNSDNYTTNIPIPMVNQFITLNGGANPPVLSGVDPEDCNAGCTLSNKSVVIDAVPSNSQLYYDFGAGPVLLANGQQINNFDPSKLQVKITIATLGAVGTSFQYSFLDAAGKKDPTPATYTLTWMVPLPVTGFTAYVNLNGTNSMVKWETVTEQNTNYFIVERSLNNVNFSKVGNTIPASGNSSSKRTYSLADNINNLVQNNIIYYRVKLIDIDGRFKYSNVVILKLGKTAGITTWPNPFQSFITVNVNTNQPETFILRLTDAAGKAIRLYEKDFARGATQITMNELGNLAKGMYILEVRNKVSGEKNSYKFIKE